MGLTPLGNVSEPLSSLLGSGSRSPLGWVSGVRNGKVTGEPAAWELQLEAVRMAPGLSSCLFLPPSGHLEKCTT